MDFKPRINTCCFHFHSARAECHAWTLAFARLKISVMSKEPILIDKRRAAYLLDVTLGEINRLVSRSQLRTKRIGRRTLLVYSSLKKFCADASARGRRHARKNQVSSA